MRLIRAVAYAVAALLLTGVSVWTVSPLYRENEVEAALFRAFMLLFLLACVLLGVGVYLHRNFAKKQPLLRADSRFWLIFGGVVLAVAVVLIVRFGGIGADTAADTLRTAGSLTAVLIGAVPLPGLVRGAVLAFGLPRGKARAAALVAVCVSAIVFGVCVAAGPLLHTLPVSGEN